MAKISAPFGAPASTPPPGTGQNNISHAFNFAGIALLLLLAGIGVAYLLNDMAGRQANLPQSVYSAPFVAQNLAGTRFRIPTSWYHAPLPNEGAFADQIDLQIYLSFAPGMPPLPLDIRITAASAAQPSAYLLDAVYIKQFSARQIEGPIGLVGKPLKAAEGFQNETVWYDPLSANPFVAKCIAPVEKLQSASCLRTVYLPANIAVTYQFQEELLAYWKEFDTILDPWLTEMGVPLSL